MGLHHLHFVSRGDRARTGNDFLLVHGTLGRALFVCFGTHRDVASRRLLDIIDANWPTALGDDVPGLAGLEGASPTEEEELPLVQPA